MKLLVSGSSGLIGSSLVAAMKAGGHTIGRIVREGPHADPSTVRWNLESGTIDAAAMEGYDAVAHLAGENIAGRWGAEKKRRIRESRVRGTRLLAEALAKLSKPPKVLACASAIGFYGNRGDEVLTEESASGTDFLSEVCREWEAATKAAADKGIRVVNLRFGVVLSARGGALAKMLFPFRWGAGGIVGDGRQYWSWISLADVVDAIQHALATESLTGPVNVVSPQPVTNREFTNTLGTVLHRPTLFPMPAFATRLVFGEMADALLLASQRVEPARLTANRYSFSYPDLESALRFTLAE